MNAQLNPENPSELFHPLLMLFRPTVATPPIERLADSVLSALDAGYRGLGVYGHARFGKTSAATYLMEHPSWLGNRPAAQLFIQASGTPKRTESGFYRGVLGQLKVRIPARVTNDSLCELTVGRLIEVCADRGTRLAVLFIDEAQRLLPADYENLVSIDNRMTREGYYFFCVFLYQRDITGYSNESIGSAEHPPHVAGRFLVRKLEFTGLDGIEEVAYVLARYDEGTEWPAGSGINYTQHFASDAFAQGFRLAHYAERLWTAASHLRAEARLSDEWTWPMKSFEGAVVHLLTNVAANNASFERFSDADLVLALRAAGLIELELSRMTYKPQGEV